LVAGFAFNARNTGSCISSFIINITFITVYKNRISYLDSENKLKDILPHFNQTLRTLWYNEL